MDVSRIRALRGPNLWSRHTAIEAIVSCTEAERSIDALPGFEARLRSRFPEIGLVLQTGQAGPVSMARALELSALGLQASIGCPVTFSRCTETVEPGIYQVVVEYGEEAVGRLALELAQSLCRAAAEDTPFDLGDALSRLQELDEDERLGPSTGSIVEAAMARGIPFRRQTSGSLVQFGWGSRQRRILAAETDATSAIAEAIAQDKELTKTECSMKNSRKLMVGMNLRYRPDCMLIRSLIDAGEIGEPFYVKCGWIRKQSSTEKWFNKREEAGGGVILDLRVNLIDLALWLADYPKAVSVSTKNYYHRSGKLEDTSVSFIRCEKSVTISIEASWSRSEEKDIFYANVYGTKGSIGANPFKLIKVYDDEHIDLGSTYNDSPTEAFKKSYLNELKSFIGAIRGLNPIFSSGDEAIQMLTIAESMYQSAEKDKEIKISF